MKSRLLAGLPLIILIASEATAKPAEVSTVEDGTLRVERTQPEEAGGTVVLNVEGRVLLGANECTTQGVTAELEAVQDGSTIYVSPLVRSSLLPVPQDPVEHRCPLDYLPVYRAVTVQVEVDQGAVDDVVVKNVGTPGHDVTVFSQE